MKQKIIVTGGTGFIGSHTVVALHQAGYEPIIIDDFSNSSPTVLQGLKDITGVDFTFYRGDCGSPKLLDDVLSQCENIGGVIHFAAFKAVGESVAEPLKYYQNNLGSLVALLQAMEKHGVGRLVFSSSCTVYGQPEVLPVTEDSPVQPAASPYGNTKQVGEEIIRDTIASGRAFSALSLRYFNPIGAHPSAHIGELPNGVPLNLVPLVVQAAAGLRPQLNIYGHDYNTADGTCVRDYIHVVDLAEAHVAALQVLEKQPAPYYDYVNVGTGQGSTVLQVIQAFEAETGVPVPHTLAPRRPGDVEQIYARVDKSEQLLGWRTRHTLEDALRDAWRWQQKLLAEAQTKPIQA